MTGSGTLLDPYIIYDVNDLQATENDLTAYYELANDIDASATAGWNGGLGFLPIGLWVNWGAVVPPSPYIGCAGVNWKQTPFTGHFDGKGYSISGLTIHRTRFALPTTVCPDYYDVGLFSHLASGAVVQNIHLVNADIDGYDWVGGLVGYLEDGAAISNCSSSGAIDTEEDHGGGLVGGSEAASTIENCRSSANVTAGGDYAGGLIGLAYELNISDCHATGTVVAADRRAGGLTGYDFNCTITRCYATGNVTATNLFDAGGLSGYSEGSTITRCFATGDVVGGTDYIGGLIGTSLSNVSDCYARGDVSGRHWVGGLIGYLDTGMTVSNCYSTGVPTGTNFVGGLIGEGWGATVNNSFWDTDTSGTLISDGGTGKTTAEMKTAATFTGAGWDFATIWTICGGVNNDYPCLLGVTPSCVLTPVIPYVINKSYALAREEL